MFKLSESLRPTYVLFEPQHEYAGAMMDYLARAHGLKPVCVYLSSKAQVYQSEHYPNLGSAQHVEASFFLDRTPPSQVAARLQEAYEVLGVVPYAEQTLAPAAALLQHLPVAWNSPALLRLFRDKAALKGTLRRDHPHVRLNESRLVQSAEQVFAAPLPRRYVLKPNDGFANRHVGFFEHHSPRAQVARYFAGLQAPCILEEFLEGPEFAINGQMDGQGVATVLSIAEYERVHANGKHNLHHWMHHVRQDTPLFAELADYAATLMQALGLKRCPFHMEVIRTHAGPVLVEVGARLGGTRTAFATQDLHGGGVDALAMAAHAYLFDTPYPGPVTNWDHYNRVNYLHLDGIAPKTERIYSVEGLQAVERLPHFRSWVVKPEVGRTVERTQDLYQVPWSFYMVGEASRAELKALGERAKELIQFNRQVSVTQRLSTDALATLRRAQLHSRWLMRRALGPPQ